MEQHGCDLWPCPEPCHPAQHQCMTFNDTADGNLVVHAHGRVSPADHAYAHDKVARACRLTREPVRSTRVDLVVHADPARDRPAFAKAEVDVDGQLVRAHAVGGTMHAAIDLLEARLRHRLERHHDRQLTSRDRPRGDTSWRHDSDPTDRHRGFSRDAEEREVVRRKTFTIGSSSTQDALADLERLDHDFFLFHNGATGEDNVIHRTADGGYALIEPSGSSLPEATAELIEPSARRPSTMTVTGAIDLLELGDEPFVFFLDPASRRGQVVYRRYDGHYGLITPADSSA
ncbi:MAG: HPF/RaiA family ribosome-associated protein [Thermoplasmata archaeon]|nr:HPF/RaiA family ribosome-associated protein [Thermoplasmata archaeon]